MRTSPVWNQTITPFQKEDYSHETEKKEDFPEKVLLKGPGNNITAARSSESHSNASYLYERITNIQISYFRSRSGNA